MGTDAPFPSFGKVVDVQANGFEVESYVLGFPAFGRIGLKQHDLNLWARYALDLYSLPSGMPSVAQSNRASPGH